MCSHTQIVVRFDADRWKELWLNNKLRYRRILFDCLPSIAGDRCCGWQCVVRNRRSRALQLVGPLPLPVQGGLPLSSHHNHQQLAFKHCSRLPNAAAAAVCKPNISPSTCWLIEVEPPKFASSRKIAQRDLLRQTSEECSLHNKQQSTAC